MLIFSVHIRHPQAQCIPIIAMTANVFTEDVLAAKYAAMDAHIAKPIDMGLLYQALNTKMASDPTAGDECLNKLGDKLWKRN